LLRSLFKRVDIFATPQQLFEDQQSVKSGGQFGLVQLEDGKSIALFEVEVADNVVIERNRVALRGIAARFIDQYISHGALVFYYSNSQPVYRFSFISKQSQFDEFGQLTKTETHPKRFTYLFGKDENTRTAENRLVWLQSISSKKMEDVLEAFSVEKVSKEFFNLYKEQYLLFCEFLYGYHPARPVFARLVDESDDKKRREKEDKLMRDFVKKLLGRLVFLYFLQKKRWLGGKIGSTDWQDGAIDFMRQLFDKSSDKSRFYSQTLVPLYFRTLNAGQNERPSFGYHAPWGEVKIPFLNGGLFEEDAEGSEQFDFPEYLFSGLLDLFDRYNFTVDESSPNDHEIGIDPEMLGHIFENLLEENRSKAGAFYTPKEIVHYLCQESLWQYLKSKFELSEQQSDELELFVRSKIRGKKDSFVYQNAREIEAALREVHICDPAIGSGAFPMGMLHEIFHCHIELDLTQDFGKLKRDIIEHCIYGVDIDKGAVDIAQLRFWLALVVDETVPQPLPNLDYKIMQGDSLLERFEEIDLSKMMSGDDDTPKTGPLPGTDLFNTAWQGALFLDKKEIIAIRKLLHEYYQAQSKPRKKELMRQVNGFVLDKVDYKIKKEKEKLLFEKGDIQKAVARQIELKKDPAALRKNLEKKESEIVAFEQRRERLHKCLAEHEKPFFLWHLYFDEVLREHGGFDIIIGNPPYVQIQSLSDRYKNFLELEGYQTFDKGSDLYAIFYERGWQHLKPGGFLAYITSNKWMRANYGESLRKFFIEQTNPLKLLDFGMAQNFANALTYTSILLFQKSKPDQKIEICRAQADYKYGTDVHKYFQSHRANIPNLGIGSWVALTPDEYRIKNQVEIQGTPLGNEAVWKIKINRGVLTGFNDAFVVSTADKNQILENERQLTGGSKPSEALFKKMLRGQDVRAWAPEWNEEKSFWLLYIPWHFPLHEDPTITGDSKRAENLFKTEYPGAFQHLEKYKKELSQRNQAETGIRYEWYAMQRWGANYWQDFSKPKIIYPNMTKYLPFAYDMGVGYFSNDKSFILTGENLGYLVCVFNSKLFKFCFRQNFPELLGETYEVRKVFFDKIPVKKPDEKTEPVFEALAGYLAYLWGMLRADKTDRSLYGMAEFFEYLSNGLVYEVYFGEQMRSAGRDLFRHLLELPQPDYKTESREQILEKIGSVHALLSEREHPVTVNLYYLTSISDIQIIENLKTEAKA